MANDPTSLVFDRRPVPTPGAVHLAFGDGAPEPVAPGVHLVFSRPPVTTPGPVRLVFGEGDDDTPAPAIPDATLHGTGTVTGLRLHFTARTGAQLAGGGRITGLRLHIAVQYDINVSRPTVGGGHARWQAGAPQKQGGSSAWSQAAHLPVGAQNHWQAAQPLAERLQTYWDQAPRLHCGLLSVFEQASRLTTAQVGSGTQGAMRLRAGATARQQDANRVPLVPQGVRYQEAIRLRGFVRSAFENAIGRTMQVRSGMGVAAPVSPGWEFRHQNAWVPRPGQWQRPVLPQHEPCYVPALPVHLVFAEPFDASLPARLVFVCERHGPGPDPQPEPGVVVPIRKVYIVLNNITLHRVDTGAELRAHSFGMSLDYQSWTWSWQASLHHDAADYLGRDSQGDPAELAVMVNGLPFRLRLERVTRDRRFNPTRWGISGKGKASILSAPYAPAMPFGNPLAARTAQQLMQDALTINGVGIGWSVDWGLQDWLVPAGAWAMQGSYIDAINDIAAAAGGYVQPHPTDSVLCILPSYPAAPWDWGSITPDFEIPANAAEVEGIEYIDKPAYNRVFVSGVGTGVFGPLRRTGTAGDVIAPQVTHSLITDAVVHRQRGVAELSNTGRQEHVTLNMQVLPETGVIVPGQFVRYLGDRPMMGIVRSTSIDWSFPKLRQTIKLETHA